MSLPSAVKRNNNNNTKDAEQSVRSSSLAARASLLTGDSSESSFPAAASISSNPYKVTDFNSTTASTATDVFNNPLSTIISAAQQSKTNSATIPQTNYSVESNLNIMRVFSKPATTLSISIETTSSPTTQSNCNSPISPTLITPRIKSSAEGSVINVFNESTTTKTTTRPAINSANIPPASTLTSAINSSVECSLSNVFNKPTTTAATKTTTQPSINSTNTSPSTLTLIAATNSYVEDSVTNAFKTPPTSAVQPTTTKSIQNDTDQHSSTFMNEEKGDQELTASSIIKHALFRIPTSAFPVVTSALVNLLPAPQQQQQPPPQQQQQPPPPPNSIGQVLMQLLRTDHKEGESYPDDNTASTSPYTNGKCNFIYFYTFFIRECWRSDTIY